ncbi:N-acetylneuraminic acid mutarotase [Rhodopirellula rubra]|uniref:N-acetylneuraminic acid mutarotase n=1 Tax=Aporhodopirellula rubra TaxID=980271 RepID=A0A7W5H9B4_9BACT|nr:kelch repeat-containing protein [Aporhodopirellula rubra]MBB3209935.1 N-acetylneuraminic acid mutarotase [Aporhodopirellula rubra]
MSLCRLRVCLSVVTALAWAIVSLDVAIAEKTSVPMRWQPLITEGAPHARHEAAFVECDGRFFLMGGRRIKPVDIFHPETKTWTQGAKPPIEIHHFQPVVWENRIWLAGAMTGRYPHETPIDRIMIYDPRTDEWSWGSEIPEDRRRGGAGAVIHDGGLYLVCGIRNGHWDGWVNWLDRLDLKTGQWEQLPGAPRVRDHFQVAVVGGKLYAAGGRKTSGVSKEVFSLTIPEVDVYDIENATWTTLPEASDMPTPRAGCFAISFDGKLLVAGGESSEQKTAYSEILTFDPGTQQWQTTSTFSVGRHGTGVIYWDGALYTSAGSGGRGGGPELNTTEMLRLK